MDSAKKKNLPVSKNLGTLRSGKQEKSISGGGDTAATGPKASQIKNHTSVPRQQATTVDRLKPPGSRLPLPTTALKSGPGTSAKKCVQAVGSSVPPPRPLAKPNPITQARSGCVGSGTRGICRITPGVLPGKDRNPPVNQPKNHVKVIGNCSTHTASPAAVPDPIEPAIQGASHSGVGHIATETPSPSVSGVLGSNMFECAQPTEVQVAEDVLQVANSTYVASPVVQEILQNSIPSFEQDDSHVLDCLATSGANPSGVSEESSVCNQPDKAGMVKRLRLEKAAAEDRVKDLTEQLRKMTEEKEELMEGEDLLLPVAVLSERTESQEARIQSLVRQALSDRKRKIELETKRKVERDCARAEFRKRVEEEVMKSGDYSGDQQSKKALQDARDGLSNENRLETDPTKAPMKSMYKTAIAREKASKLASILARAPGRKP